MYNRYIPNGAAYTRVLEEDLPPSPPMGRQSVHHDAPREPQREQPQAQHQTVPPPRAPEPPPRRDDAGSEKKIPFLSGLLKTFKLDSLDTGDILLLLILLFLVLDGDGDNLELIITLGLVILFSLGDKDKEKESD